MIRVENEWGLDRGYYYVYYLYIMFLLFCVIFFYFVSFGKNLNNVVILYYEIFK